MSVNNADFRKVAPTRYRNEDLTSLATSVPGVFDPACPVFHGTNTGTPWTGALGNGGANTTTVGCDAKTENPDTTAVGWKVESSGLKSCALGTSIAARIVHSLGENSVAVGTPGDNLGGNDLVATGKNDVVLGCNVATAGTGGNNICVGIQSGVLADASVGSGYFGANGAITGSNSWVVGQTLIAGDDNIVVGNVTGGTGDRNVYIQANRAAAPTHTGDDQTHVGSGQVSSTANQTTSFGAQSGATALNAVAVGFSAVASAAESTCLIPNVTNAAPNSTILGNNGLATLRLQDPAVGTLIRHVVEVADNTATPTPTIAQLAGGQFRLGFAGATTFTQTNITGAALDAFAAFAPLAVGMQLVVNLVATNGATDIIIGAAAAGVTQQGILTGVAGQNRRIIYTRVGADTWNADVY